MLQTNSNEILLISPYEDLIKTAANVSEEININFGVALGNLADGVRIAQNAERDGVKVIVTRGGTYEMIRQAVNIPVVEIQVTGYDILRALKPFLNDDRPIVVLGYQNMMIGVDALSEVLNVNLLFDVICDESEVPGKIHKYASEGITKFVGDAIGAKVAFELGYDSRIIISGKEALIMSLEEALRVLKVTENERAKSKQFNIIMDFVHDGIVAIDKDGNTSLVNKMAKDIFAKSNNSSSMSIEKLYAALNLLQVLNTRKPELDQLITLGEISVVVNRVPILIDNNIKGVVATFQDVTHIQNMEHKIRRESRIKGLVAKYTFNDIVYKSEEMQSLIEQAIQYAKIDDTTILILGETGTGKELFAHSLHNESLRSGGPFVAINCAALPSSLLESELFGYADGAFTGARKGGKIGLFELAHNGTIFLDEIGDIPIELQTRLLRIIQEKEIMRIGDDRIIPINVKIIASTNKDLFQSVENNEFRRDLFYRLNTLTLSLPALRDRPKDINTLAEYFIDKFCIKHNKQKIEITEEALKFLGTLSFKGNVRELEGLIERSVILTRSGVIDLKIYKSSNINTSNALNSTIVDKADFSLKTIESKIIEEVLQLTNNNVNKTAEILGINRTTIWRKLKKNNDS